MNILFASSEVFPFAKTGGLADVSRSLPKALAAMGHDVRVIMPFYRSVRESGFEIKKECVTVRHPLSGRIWGFDVLSNRSDDVTTYFVRKDRYFDREKIYGTENGDYPDNDIRFSFFSKSVLAALEPIAFKPDIIHCNDWQTALVPFYLKFKLPDSIYHKNIKVLFTIHNLAYQGLFNRRALAHAGIPDSFFHMQAMEFHGKVNFLKAGVLYSDMINTVSRRYAREIMTPEYGCGLEGLLRTREDRLSGILNGVDYDEWSPEKDIFIAENYGPSDIENKKACKKDLLKRMELDVSAESPLIGCVTRLVHQKGMDLLAGIADELIEMGAGLIVLGYGDKMYNKLFLELEKKYPGKMRLSLELNDELAHKIEAGCDIFVMPSRYEPCGLNQMYSVKYGTVPVVRATGGLDDAIVDFDEDNRRGNGFKFGPATEEALLDAAKRAITRYGKKDLWKRIMLQAMNYDFSWGHSAGEYVKLYERMMERGI